MSTTPLARIDKEIAAIRAKLAALGPMHPGSLSRQYQVCGRAGCRCADPRRPQRHGPYHKLGYVHRGRPVCRFVRAACVQELAGRLAAYKTFRKLIDRWIALSIERGRREFFPAPAPRKHPRRSKAAASKP